jgi:hypothetical protein
MRKYLFIIMVAILLFSANAYTQTMSPLKSYWCEDRIDYFGTATGAGQKAAVEAFGCKFTRLEGYVLTGEQPGALALDLYWNEEKQDNGTIAAAESKAEALAAGYRKTASEGYMYPTEQAGTVPLKLYFKADINDYYTTTAKAGEKAAIEAGYKLVRIEGYIMPATGNDAAATSK